jgi:23S rRNA pseudouridine1911/1915/1917 synthase
MIEDGKISCNREVFTKNKKIYRGNLIEITWDIKPMELAAENIAIDILYENDDFAIINKDAGMNTHPTPGEEGRRGTLVNALLHHFQSLGTRSEEIENKNDSNDFGVRGKGTV